MASAIKNKISKVAGRSSTPDPEAKEEAEKYRLVVTAGPSYDPSTHQKVHVNIDTPVTVENEFMKAKIKVRIRNYQGLPSTSPSSTPYFDLPAHSSDQYSVAFSFVPKVDIPSKDTVWGNDFDHPIRDRLPPGFNYAFRIVKEFIDPGLTCDAYADEPWLYGPSLGCWFTFRINDKVDLAAGEDFAAPAEDSAMEEGASGSGVAVREKLGLPANNQKRRKHFLSEANREAMVFEKGRMYEVDFFNPYIDFGNFALKLPGFSLKVLKYVDNKSHTLRYVFKNLATGDVYFDVNFNLLWGDELTKAVEDDAARTHAQKGAHVTANGHETHIDDLD